MTRAFHRFVLDRPFGRCHSTASGPRHVARPNATTAISETLMWRRREQARGKRIRHGRVQFSPPDRQATGTPSRPLQYVSRNRVDFGCFSKTSVKSASGGNCHRANALTPEVARHQSVHDRATFAFDSRRLHQPSRSCQAKVAQRSFSEIGVTQSVTRYGWQANARTS